MPIPEFRADGYLPEGVHRATEAEVLFRFGTGTRRRRNLALRLRHWMHVARAALSRRLLVDGSFVTSKAAPADVDAVVLVEARFEERLANGEELVVELSELLSARTHEHLFAAMDEAEWTGWVEFFGRTREQDDRRKGIIEVEL